MIDQVFDGFWMKPAYRIPDNDCACVEPGTTPAATRPIGRFNVRSFITSVQDGARVRAGQPTVVRGIAFDGGQGIREVAYSTDGGQTWREAKLGADLGRYSFREFTFGFTPDKRHVRPARARLEPLGPEPADGSAVAARRLHAQRRRVGQGHGRLKRPAMRPRIEHPSFAAALAAACAAPAHRQRRRPSQLPPDGAAARSRARCPAMPRRRRTASPAIPPSTCSTSRRPRRAPTGTRWSSA